MDADPAAGAPRLGFGLSFADLADRAGLVRLDRVFLAQLEAEDAGLHARLLAARAAPAALPEKAASELIVALGPVLDAFVAALFGIADDVLALARRTHELDPVHACKRLFVQRQAVKKYADPNGVRRCGLACGAGGPDRRATDRAGLRHQRGGVGGVGRPERARPRAALCRLGDADAGGAGGAPRRHAVPRAAPGRPAAPGAGSRRSSATASPCCACPSTTGGRARGSR